jgi:hypothetical protein
MAMPRTRQALTSFAIGCLLLLSLLPGSSRAALALGFTAFFGLFIAAIFLLLESRAQGPAKITSEGKWSWPQWALAYGCIAGVCVALIQVWYLPKGSLAFGDVYPPNGVAWIGRLFEAWTWSGNSLGSPGTLAQGLPWAVVEWCIHSFGGSATLAQDLWYCLLFAGGGIATVALVRLLGYSPGISAVAALFYCLSMSVVSAIGYNPVFLAAFALLPALLAIVLARVSGRIRFPTAILLLILSVPFLGYSYDNPPLLGMLLLALLATTPACWVVAGRDAGRKAALLVGTALPLMAVASCYWLVPAMLALHGAAVGTLASPASWTWTEGRATLGNALWLNTSWEWPFRLYYPYAGVYRTFPLSALRFSFPVLAFSSLVIRDLPSRIGHRHARAVSLVALAVLSIIFISTGTRLPGAPIFDALYSLPFGWLLQEPGRFLLAASLGYTAMACVALDLIVHSTLAHRARAASRRTYIAVLAGSTIVGIAALAAGFPVVTGALVPGPWGRYPSQHVQFPKYWSDLGGWLNSSHAPRGALLTLPVDDFYQMPYRWYYGSDGFIVSLLRRHVVDPVGQGYFPGSTELIRTVSSVSAALLAHRWTAASELLGAVGTSIVLVRGDLIPMPGRDYAPPAELGAALKADPYAHLAGQFGPLSVYQVHVYAPGGEGYATVDTPSPDPLDLTALPPGTALVTGRPRAGHASVYDLPVSGWETTRTGLTATVRTPPGWRDVIALVRGDGTDQSYRVTAPTSQAGAVRVEATVSPAGTRVRLYVPFTRSLITDGSFGSGAWGPVGDCNDVLGPAGRAGLHAVVVRGAAPGGYPALQLAASDDSACEAQAMSWEGGGIYLSMWIDHVAGAPVRICLWESPLDRCAQLPPLPTSSGWRHIRVALYPDPGTTAVSLYLYADATGTGELTVNRYADIKAYGIASRGTPVIVATPPVPAARHGISVAASSFSSMWQLPKATHVEVDGLRNGWLQAPAGSSPTYRGTGLIKAADALGLLALLFTGIGVPLTCARPRLAAWRRHWARRNA